MLNKNTKQHTELLLSGVGTGSVNDNLTTGAMQGSPNGQKVLVRSEFIEEFSWHTLSLVHASHIDSFLYLQEPDVTGNVSDQYRQLMYNPSARDALYSLGLLVTLLFFFILLISLLISGSVWYFSRH